MSTETLTETVTTFGSKRRCKYGVRKGSKVCKKKPGPKSKSRSKSKSKSKSGRRGSKSKSRKCKNGRRKNSKKCRKHPCKHGLTKESGCKKKPGPKPGYKRKPKQEEDVNVNYFNVNVEDVDENEKPAPLLIEYSDEEYEPGVNNDGQCAGKKNAQGQDIVQITINNVTKCYRRDDLIRLFTKKAASWMAGGKPIFKVLGSYILPTSNILRDLKDENVTIIQGLPWQENKITSTVNKDESNRPFTKTVLLYKLSS